ncbi:hypothetical protein [Micromonospora zamorensis]|uniref:hypothetical protein n=1 Tax=Micromonospora zamorensis TaxID=709883 RepID=UPI00379B0B34
MPAFALVGVAIGRPWYHPLPHGPILLLSALSFAMRLRRQGGLPLRLTDDFLELTIPGGEPVRIDWPNVSVAQVRGRINPVLVVDLVDPERTRPVLNRWEWGRLGRWDRARARRPQEVHISLVGVVPELRRLRAELAHRLTRSADLSPKPLG